ncbi:hypothetical protein [Pelagerythrobacter sp.]|uniref:hypothetical protein n=1 Tax=Pelagerythrobacter sp. TaxID=2800702 RepID=UPI0035AD9EA9
MSIALALLSLVAAEPVAVNAALLEGLPVVEARLEAHGEVSACTGPTLASVVARMGAASGREVRGEALRTAVLARARDGYAVLFSLGEIEPLLGDAPIIVATRCDDAPLDDEVGPYRLVAEGEARAARSVRQLESLAMIVAE